MDQQIFNSPLSNTSALSDTLIVRLTSGTFRGAPVQVHSPSVTLERWLGIPYAQPPVGELRFRAPRPINTDLSGFSGADEVLHAVRDAVQFGNACPQPLVEGLGAEMSEDCLYLNVGDL